MVAKFHIFQADPHRYKDIIFKYWDKYLPGTNKQRLGWMISGNPAGSSIWVFAIDEKERICGMLSLMPKRLISSKMNLMAGILGDYMVDEKYRAFGPALSLLKEMVKVSKKFNIDFLYTIPNQRSEKLVQRAGFSRFRHMRCMIKPVNVSRYCNRFVGKTFIPLYSPIVNMALKLSSVEQYSSKGRVREIYKFDSEFNELLNKFTNNNNIYGERSVEYLKWRYIDNPQIEFRIFGYYREKIEGYAVATIGIYHLEIYDLVCTNTTALYSIIKNLRSVAAKNKLDSIYIRLTKNNSALNMLKFCLFFNVNDNISIYSTNPEYMNRLLFVSGDRNI